MVGINQYDNLRRLDYAERDAASVRDLFGEMGFEKVDFFAKDAPAIVADNGVEASAEPTFGRLSNFLRRWLASKPLTDGDTLWFFFAGHGKREGERDYLMPIDADPGNVAGTGLAVRDLTEQLRGSGAGNVILLIDACRNDGSRDGVGIGLEQQQGVITLFSCAPEQQSYEMDELQAGAFTYALLQGLRIQGEGNCATVARLAEHVRVQVPYLTQRYRKGPQNPYLVAEPVSKQNLILLPNQSSPADLMALKYAALQAENQDDRDLARDFWWRVSAISNSSDIDARQAIERLAKTSPATPSLNTKALRLDGSSGSRSSSQLKMLIWANHLFHHKRTRESLFSLLIALASWQYFQPHISRQGVLPIPSSQDSPSKSSENQELLAIGTQEFSQGEFRKGTEAVAQLLDNGALVEAESALNAVPSKHVESSTISYIRGRLTWESIKRQTTAYSYTDARRNWSSAVKEEPNNVHYRTTLGFGFYSERNWEEAAKTWEQASQMSSGDANKDTARESLTAYAGQALALVKQSEQTGKPDAVKMQKAKQLRDQVIRADQTTFTPSNLAKDWRWTEQSIRDWEKLLALK